MYCKRCGKEIRSGTICAGCAAEQFDQHQKIPEFTYAEGHYPYYSEPDPTKRMYGFGKALAGMILGMIGFFMSYIACIIADLGSDATGIIIIMTFPFIILPLMFGISSIKTFKRRSRARCAKPIPTLILGIASLSTIPGTVVYILLAFLVNFVTSSFYY